jgi:hypothetical protein
MVALLERHLRVDTVDWGDAMRAIVRHHMTADQDATGQLVYAYWDRQEATAAEQWHKSAVGRPYHEVELLDPVVWVKDPRTGLLLPNGSQVVCIWGDEAKARAAGITFPQGWWLSAGLLGFIPSSGSHVGVAAQP